MSKKGFKLQKINHKACCDKPLEKYHSSFADEDGRCANCGKYKKHAWIEKKWKKVDVS